MKKVFKRLSVYFVLGGLSGFLFTTFIVNPENSLDLSGLAMPFIVTLLVAVIGLLAFSLIGYLRIRTYAGQMFEGEEEDAMEEKMYRLSSDIGLAATLATIICMTGMSVVILTETLFFSLIPFLICLLLGVWMSFLFAAMTNKLYPERNLPAVSDKNYAEKMLEMADDGERHVMLGGLFKSYQTVNSLLFFAILFLLFYSLATNTSQVVGIIVIAVILIVTNARYSLSIRNK